MTVRWIEALCEPTRLLLTWQGPKTGTAGRYRYAVGEVTAEGASLIFRYFQCGGEFEAHNQGRRYAELEALGYRGYPAFDRTCIVHREGVRGALMRRLPPRSRSDFGEYAEHFRLPVGSELSDLALLGRTEAMLPSDGFALVDPLDSETRRCDVFIEVVGYRHHAKQQPACLGEPVEVLPDPDNAFDPDAVELRVRGAKIGNINRLQARTFGRWLEVARIEAWVERLNGTPEHPRAFIFVRVTPLRTELAA